MEALMKAIHWIIAVAAFVFAEPVQAGVNDPEIIIYRFPGVVDIGGGANTASATVFHCTNFSGVTENIRLVTRGSDGVILSNVANIIDHLNTKTFATKFVASYFEISLNTGAVVQGTTAIAATSINVTCTAMSIDAASFVPIGVALRGIRFNPIPGSQE